MLALILLFIGLMPLTLLASALENIFSPTELRDMGVCLDHSHA
jgi:hypothetical protein